MDQQIVIPTAVVLNTLGIVTLALKVLRDFIRQRRNGGGHLTAEQVRAIVKTEVGNPYWKEALSEHEQRQVREIEEIRSETRDDLKRIEGRLAFMEKKLLVHGEEIAVLKSKLQ